MTPAMRRNLIEEELIFAVQHDKLTQRERFLALWYLQAGGWTLDHPGIRTELKATVLEVCTTLRRPTDNSTTTKQGV